mmetsp:Transcript_37422/g.67320  ORF Transcript_37422/g.67320 Transcript_37422/m.67320 type:complete len:608 (-) Transcript_37422:526-2349(-)
MGLINSHFDFQKPNLEDNDDTTPVMGDGYDPIYEAALVGDWTRLVKLCDGAMPVNHEDEDGAAEEGAEQEVSNKEKQVITMNKILGRMHRQFREEKGRGPDPSELLKMRKALAGQLGVDEVGTMNMILGRMLRHFREEKGRGPDSLELLEMRKVLAGRLGVEVPPLEDEEACGWDEMLPTMLKKKLDNNKKVVVVEENNETLDLSISEEESQFKDESTEQQQQKPFTLFIDAKGNTPLHLACRRDPPLFAIRALLALHSPSVWKKTHDGWIPLHLACHCGCDVEVANELLNVMEESSFDDEQTKKEDRWEGEVDRLLPRDVRGRTPLHLACVSLRDPRRRPDLVRLLLLRSKDPKRAVLVMDWFDFDQRVGLDLAWGDLKVLTGSLTREHEAINNEDDDSTDSDKGMTNGAGSASNGSLASKQIEQQPATASVGRTPLNLIEDDYREELEEALLPEFSIAKAIAACQGEDVEDATITDNLDAMYECWAMLSLLVLAAGTPGPAERVKAALGGMTDADADDKTTHNDGETSSPDISNVALLGSFSKPCHEVVQDFQAIHHACQSLDVCPDQFKELVKKFLQGQVDKRSMGSVSALMNQWELRGSFKSR